MNKLVLVFTVTLSISSLKAMTIRCGIFDSGGTAYNTSVISDVMFAKCQEFSIKDDHDEGDKKSYYVLIKGLGKVALSKDRSQHDFLVSCPGAKNIVGKYYGVKGSVTFGLGLDQGLFLGKNTCYLKGINHFLGAGYNITMASLKIYDRYPF